MASNTAAGPRLLGVIEQELAILCDMPIPDQAKQLWIVYRSARCTQTLSFAIEEEVLNCTAGLIAEFAQDLLQLPKSEALTMSIAFYPSRRNLRCNLSANESIMQLMGQREAMPEAVVLEIWENEEVNHHAAQTARST
eukprot:s1406_g9.t1